MRLLQGLYSSDRATEEPRGLAGLLQAMLDSSMRWIISLVFAIFSLAVGAYTFLATPFQDWQGFLTMTLGGGFQIVGLLGIVSSILLMKMISRPQAHIVSLMIGAAGIVLSIIMVIGSVSVPGLLAAKVAPYHTGIAIGMVELTLSSLTALVSAMELK